MTLCDKAITLIPKFANKRENMIGNIYYCLRDFLLAEPNDLLANKDIASKVFQTIEFGILGELVTPKTPALKPDPTAQPSDPKKQTLKKDKKSQSSSNKYQQESLEYLFNELRESPSHSSYIIREASEILLMQLLNQYNNFPCPGGPEVINSYHLLDYEDPSTVHFVYNDVAIISFTEVPQSNGARIARVTIRDSTGKYSWDSSLIYEKDITTASNNKSEQLSKSIVPPSTHDKTPLSTSSTSQTTANAQPIRKKGEILKYAENVNLGGIDMLSEALAYLAEVSPEVHPSNDPKAITNPDIMDPTVKDAILEKENALEKQHKIEQQRSLEQKSNYKPISGSAFYPQKKGMSSSIFQQCRLFLSNLEFFSKEGLKRLHYLTEDNQRFLRSLKELDQLPGREIFKMGVIYVAPGQVDQREILRNSTGSGLYSEFLKGLGWFVDLKTHPGFVGGLDRNYSTGKVSPYFSSPSLEVMYHVPTLMPSHPQDDQQIEKKKHVGNDFTHIVWSEHKRDYKPTTISSSFNEAHIVIYPLPNGLFRIQIFRKEKISFFGPLLDGMVVNKKILSVLVRQTGINGSRRARNLTKGYTKPFPTRNLFIKEIIQRFKTEKSFDEFHASMFPIKEIEEKPQSGGGGWVSVK